MYTDQPQDSYYEPQHEPQRPSRGKVLGAWVCRHPILALVALAGAATVLVLLSPYLIVIGPVVLAVVLIHRALKVPENRARVGAAISSGKTRISDAIELHRSRRGSK